MTEKIILDKENYMVYEGDVYQIDPDCDEVFGGCFVVVTEVKQWGIQGYVTIPGEDGGNAYVRKKFNEIERVGVSVWMRTGEKDESSE